MLGNMRSLGHFHATANIDNWPDEPVLAFGSRMRCSRRGHLDASVRPDCAVPRSHGSLVTDHDAATVAKGHGCEKTPGSTSA
jgi:hypothetical protein